MTKLTVIPGGKGLVVRPPADQLKNPVLQFMLTLPSVHSRRTMMLGLRSCLAAHPAGVGDVDPETFPWWTARHEDTNAIRGVLAAKFKPTTANTYLAALRGVLKQCYLCALMTFEAYGRVGSREALPAIKGSTLPAGRHLADAEIMAMYRSCDRSHGLVGLRDAAIWAVLIDAGLRRAEVAALDVPDIDRDQRRVQVRAGKGRKARAVPLSDEIAARTAAWCAAADITDGPLFCALARDGIQRARRLGDKPIYRMLTRRAQAAKLKHFSPHDTRRTFASDALEAGVDLVTVQHLLGHASSETTARYDRRDERAGVTGIERLVAHRQQRRTVKE